MLRQSRSHETAFSVVCPLFYRISSSTIFWWCPTKICFVWPRWCLSTTFVLSREKNYSRPFPGSQQVLKKWDSKLYLYACASWRKKGYADQQISIRGEGAKDGTVVRVLTSHQGARVQIPASMPYVGWVSCWFSPLVREVFLRVLQFSPLLKTNISKFSFDQESGQRRTTTRMCYLQIIIYLFIYLEVKSRAVL